MKTLEEIAATYENVQVLLRVVAGDDQKNVIKGVLNVLNWVVGEGCPPVGLALGLVVEPPEKLFGTKNSKDTEYNKYELWLEDVHYQKHIQTIKKIREITNLGLKEAKDIVDAVRDGERQLVFTYYNLQEAQKVLSAASIETGSVFSILETH